MGPRSRCAGGCRCQDAGRCAHRSRAVGDDSFWEYRVSKAKSKVPEVYGLRDVNLATIYPHVFDNADREVGGVLIGRAPRDSGLPLITGAIPAVQADEQRATLTFTQDSWAHVHRVLDS